MLESRRTLSSLEQLTELFVHAIVGRFSISGKGHMKTSSELQGLLSTPLGIRAVVAMRKNIGDHHASLCRTQH